MTRLFPAGAFSLVSTLIVLLASPGGSQKEVWVEVRSPHFTVASDAGEKQARRIADQFEQFRAMFHGAFGQLQVDSGRATVILAAKNESTMKALLPEDYEVKGHVHPAGLYQQGLEKDYVLLRVDASGDHPFHALYHEYTHALLHMNFANVPLWLDEGLAEFYGNSVLDEKTVKVGVPDPGHLYLLQQSKLLPIDVLLGVDHGSPYYNEANRASVFYAESWALVHYLMLDQQARQMQLLSKFLASWGKSGNQLDAAREAFGDLKRFGDVLSAYARQSRFYAGSLNPSTEARDEHFTARPLSEGETLAMRGDFCTHKNHLDQAEPLLQQALQLEPKLAVAHENLGIYYYYKRDPGKAGDEISRAMQLGASDFIAFYFHGLLLTGPGGSGESERNEAASSLEKALTLNPQFAPSCDALAEAYSRDPASSKKAIAMGAKAVALEPGNRLYRVHLAYLLLNAGRDLEARHIGEDLLKAAQKPQEQQMARDLLARIEEHQRLAEIQKGGTPTASPAATGAFSNADGTTVVLKHRSGTDPAGGTQARNDPARMLLGMDGVIRDADCSKSPGVRITLDHEGGELIFYAPDMARITVSAADIVKAPELAGCKQLVGRQAKIWFHPAAGKDFSGEMTRIHFF